MICAYVTTYDAVEVAVVGGSQHLFLVDGDDPGQGGDSMRSNKS